MTDIPKAAIEAGAAAIYATMSRYPLSKAGETANRVCREEAEAAIRAALPHLDGCASGQEAMREAAAVRCEQIQGDIDVECDERAAEGRSGFSPGNKGGDVYALIIRALPIAPAPDQHPDDAAVDCFTAALKEKLAKKRAEGRGGWDDKAQCSQERLSQLLRDHVEKGDPVDVGNLAMMLHQRGDVIAPAPDQNPDGADDRLADAYQIVGALASSFGVMDTPEVQSALDYLSGKPDAPCPLPFVAPSAWRPISEAQKDGTRYILAKMEGFFGRPKALWWASTGYWSTEWKYWTDGLERLASPTHFMEIPNFPAPPASEKEPQK